jgi:hypothetical protein
MSRLAGTRIATFGLLAAALVGLWQSLRLERWSFDGPSAGFFPQLVAAVCVVLALIVLVSPGKGSATEENDSEDAGKSAETTRTFAIYSVSFVVLALGAMFAGFVATSFAVSILIVRFAERRSWTAAIACGAVCAIVGLVCFGWLLRVELPETAIERAFYSLVR